MDGTWEQGAIFKTKAFFLLFEILLQASILETMLTVITLDFYIKTYSLHKTKQKETDF
jgi:hypothetical protein